MQRVPFAAEHSPHAPFGWQAGVAPPQSPSPPQARQALVVRSQTGVCPAHWAFEVQATQTPRGTSHAGVAPPQRAAFEAEH